MVLECRQLMSAFLYPAIKVKSTVRVFVDYQIITQVKDLERVCQQAREADVVMLDTKFVRTRTYYPQLGLIPVV